jgi:DNA-binding transcriptional regulator PaaX
MKVRRGSKADDTSEPTTAPKGIATPRPKPPSKMDQVITLLSRPTGATLNDLVEATGWQPHSTRAALTGMKKKGHVIRSEKIDGTRRYRIGNPS